MDTTDAPSVWTEAATAPVGADSVPRAADVVVVGAGIAGALTALLVARTGAHVLVVDRRAPGLGTTGRSTAKVTALHGAVLGRIASLAGRERAASYAAANLRGLASLRAIVESDGIDCAWREGAASTYTEDPGSIDRLETEADLLRLAGAEPTIGTDHELPWTVAGALRLDGQASVDPVALVAGLLAADPGPGTLEFGVLDVQSVERAHDCVHVSTADLTVRAEHAVIATHIPIVDRGVLSTRCRMERSYVLAVGGGPVISDMHLGIDAPGRSIRALSDGRLLIGGESHEQGSRRATPERWEALERFTAQRLGTGRVTHRWSSFDAVSTDGLPFIGKEHGGDRIWVATGFGKWGFTNAAVAGAVIADGIAGRVHEHASTFDPRRGVPRSAVIDVATHGASVGRHAIAGTARRLAHRPAAGPICTHLGCPTEWNAAERSWDCPCHGSRFATAGHVLDGPACKPTAAKEGPA